MKTRSTAAWSVLLVAVFFALAAGLLESGRLVVLRFLLHRIVFQSTDALWLAPIGNLMLYAVPAIVLAIFAFVVPRKIVFQLAVFVFAFLAIAALLLMLWETRVSIWATLILAAGASVQLARIFGERMVASSRLVQRSVLIMGATVIVLGVGIAGGRKAGEWAAARKLPVPSGRAPNVVLIILDTVRAKSLSLFGYDRPTTPNLERRAQRGTVFTQAMSTTSWTLPSHASIFTGLYPHKLTADWTIPLDDSEPTLAERLRDAGYVTAGFTANLAYTSSETGLARGFLHYEDYRLTRRQIILSSALGRALKSRNMATPAHRLNHPKPGELVTGGLLDWLDEKGERPFFAFLNYYDAHRPLRSPPEFLQRFDEEKKLVRRYSASIAYLDSELERLFAELERRGLLSNTLVIVTSDHGELFGEHGLDEHGNSLYAPVIHVPLLMFGAGVPAGVAVTEPVSLRDLPATVLDLARLESRLPGRSLRVTWAERGAEQPNDSDPVLGILTQGIRIPAEWRNAKGPVHSILANGLQYIRNADASEELYANDIDPDQLNNLVRTPQGRSMLPWYRDQFAREFNPEAKPVASKSALPMRR